MRVCDACNEGGSSLHIQSVGSSRAPLCSGVFFSYMVFEDYALSFLAGHCSKILLLKAGLCFLLPACHKVFTALTILNPVFCSKYYKSLSV